jgi:outer membrane protein assembly factor BamD
MNFINHFILILLFVIFASCSKEKLNESVIKEKSLDGQVLEAYSEGLDSLKGGDVLFAAKKFNEAEMLFPQSEWAPKSSLMAAYSYYSQDYLEDAIAELDRFLRVYPLSKDRDYALYLLANAHYEKIIDETKDLQSILLAKKNFNRVIKQFPQTEYALDSEFKLDLINDILASKEMYIGRYYFDRKKWIPAINRFRSVIDDYDTTIYVEEALHRLVEVYYTIGLINEAKKYANILGYNYGSSRWYETSYAVFNKDYERKRIKTEKKKKSFLNKAKSLFALDE